MNYKLILLIIGLCTFIFILYREINQLKDNYNDMKILFSEFNTTFITHIKNNIEQYIKQIKKISTDNLDQLKEINILHHQPITKITNHFTETLDSEIHSNINYLSDIATKNRNKYYMSEDNKNKNSNNDETSTSTLNHKIFYDNNNKNSNIFDPLLSIFNMSNLLHQDNYINLNTDIIQFNKIIELTNESNDDKFLQKSSEIFNKNILLNKEQINKHNSENNSENNIDNDIKNTENTSNNIKNNTDNSIKNDINNSIKNNTDNSIKNSINNSIKNNTDNSIKNNIILKDINEYNINDLRHIAKELLVQVSIKLDNNKWKTYKKEELYNMIKEKIKST